MQTKLFFGFMIIIIWNVLSWYALWRRHRRRTWKRLLIFDAAKHIFFSYLIYHSKMCDGISNMQNKRKVFLRR